jgi:hypothetical protein
MLSDGRLGQTRCHMERAGGGQARQVGRRPGLADDRGGRGERGAAGEAGSGDRARPKKIDFFFLSMSDRLRLMGVCLT